jgi:branched-chain amino acid aminotransferase
VLHSYVLHNNQIQPVTDLSLSPGQAGLVTGWGVFSTLRVADGVPFAWERHWARLTRDAATLHVELPHDPDVVRSRLLDLIAANGTPNCTLRIYIVRNDGPFAGPSNGRTSELIALTADSKDWGEGVKLAYVRQARHAACQFAGTKITSWAMNLTWLEEAQARGFDEVILLNERGEVAECTSANIYMAQGNEVWTPPISSGCLPGVTREIIVNELHTPGIKVIEKTVMPGDLEMADEVFITSTTRDLLPVYQIEDRKSGRSDHAREVLARAFAEYLRNYVAARAVQPAGR